MHPWTPWQSQTSWHVPPPPLDGGGVLESPGSGAFTIGRGAMLEVIDAGVAAPNVMPWPVRMFLISPNVAGSSRKPLAKVCQFGGVPVDRPLRLPASAVSITFCIAVSAADGVFGSL